MTENEPAGTLMVSNLDPKVDNTNIQELFSKFGPLKLATLLHNEEGQSLGSALIIFEKRADAVKGKHSVKIMELY